MNQQQLLIILGAGESGVGAALLGQQQGWRVFVSDGGKISGKYKSTLETAGIEWEEGKHSEERILAASCVVKSPGIPEKAVMVQAIRAKGIELISEIEFAARYKGDSRIIAITGSNGKSTTTKLAYHLMKEGGAEVAMVGNIGYSFARQVYEAPKQWYVIEVSSFQLDDIAQFRPDIAVILNITPDHLDRYNYDFNQYAAAKFRIAMNQQADDYLVLNIDDPTITKHLTDHPLKPKKISVTMNDQSNFRRQIVTANSNETGAFVEDNEMHLLHNGDDMNMSVNDLTIKGKHNQYNSMAAGISARIAGIRKEKIRESFATFEGLEHRLEFVSAVRGITFINDSKATNVNSVWFALESMKTPTVLILGGQDKGNDYNEIMELVREKVKAIVCLGVDNSKILEAFDNEVPVIRETRSAEEAVQQAYSLAENGDTVLLSPGCASFDLFKNYEDRGVQFKEAVRAL